MSRKHELRKFLENGFSLGKAIGMQALCLICSRFATQNSSFLSAANCYPVGLVKGVLSLFL